MGDRPLFWPGLLLFLLSCDGFEIGGQKIAIRIMGAFERADDSTGTYEPISETFTLKEANLVAEDGTKTLVSEESAVARINNRPLLYFDRKVPDSAVGMKFSQFEITFEPEVVGRSKYASSQKITLPSETLTYDTSFTIEKGKNIIFTVLVQWRGTVVRDEATRTDVIEVPSLRITFEQS